MIQALIAGLSVDAIIAFIIAYAVAPRGTSDFLFYFFMIIFLSGAFSIIKWAKGVLYYFLGRGERISREVLRELHRNGFPHPEGEYEIDRYLTTILNDISSEASVKIAAACLGGQLVMARSLSFAEGMMMTSAYSRAIQRYAPKYTFFQLEEDRGKLDRY